MSENADLVRGVREFGGRVLAWTIRDGRAVRMQMFLTEAEALAAASRPEDRA